MLAKLLKTYDYGALLHSLVFSKASTEDLIDLTNAETMREFSKMIHFIDLNGKVYRIKKAN
jgi:hypothetical protein